MRLRKLKPEVSWSFTEFNAAYIRWITPTGCFYMEMMAVYSTAWVWLRVVWIFLSNVVFRVGHIFFTTCPQFFSFFSRRSSS